MHLDAETLAAWFDRALDPDGMRAVETHLSSCAHCQAHAATLAQVSTAATPEAPTSESVWQRWGLRWLVPAGAVALLAQEATRYSSKTT